jgi:hypothetical protein
MPSQKKDKRKRHRHALPQLIDPALFRCIPVSIPEDPEWLALFVGAVDELGKRSAWDYDPATVADLKTVSDHWRDITDDVQQVILDGTPCEAATPSDPQDCTIISATHPAIGYFPNHPVHSPDGGGDWPTPAWCTDCNLPGLGLSTDVLIRVEAGPFFINFADMLASGLASFTLYFSGEGEIDLRFATVPAGGTVWVFPDGNPLLGLMVDLEWVDLDDFLGTALIEIFLGLIQGTLANQTTVTHETVFTTPGSHTLTGWFFPKVEVVEWPPIGWGGGLRSVQLCGDSIVLEDAPMSFELTCAAGVIGLEVNEIEVSTIDLAVCYPHPTPSAHPDWTLNRNNGDLQLLKDTVLHDSVVFPNWHTTYNPTTHEMETWRDSLKTFDVPMPAYTLVKPTTDVISLRRDGDEVSQVPDEVGEAAVETYYETYWNPKAAEPTPDWILNKGQHFDTTGYIQELFLGMSQIDIQRNLSSYAEVFQWRFEVEIANLSGGLVTFSIVDSSGVSDEYSIFTTGEGTQDFLLDLDRRYSGANIHLFITTDANETANITLSDMWERGLGMPNRALMKQAADHVVTTAVPTNWTIPDV